MGINKPGAEDAAEMLHITTCILFIYQISNYAFIISN